MVSALMRFRCASMALRLLVKRGSLSTVQRFTQRMQRLARREWPLHTPNSAA